MSIWEQHRAVLTWETVWRSLIYPEKAVAGVSLEVRLKKRPGAHGGRAFKTPLSSLSSILKMRESQCRVLVSR